MPGTDNIRSKVKMFKQHLWKCKVLEAICIKETRENNLDCGLNMNHVWSPLLHSHTRQPPRRQYCFFMSTPLSITFSYLPRTFLPTRSCHPCTHSFIMTTPTNHIFYSFYCRVHFAELWLLVESVVHQLNIVHELKRSGYDNLAVLRKVQ